MTKIEAYKLSNGEIVENKQKAIELQEEIDIKNNLIYLSEKYFAGFNDCVEMAELIYEYKDKFLNALNNTTKLK